MKKPKNNQPLNLCFVVLAMLVVCFNALGSTMIIVLLASSVISLIVFGLTLYAIGFTSIRTSLIAITAVCVVLSVWTSNWPTHVRFQMAKPGFSQLEIDIREGDVVATPCWVGTYRVKEIQQRQANVICFWTNLHPFGKTGIVKSNENPPHLNISIHHDLGDSWHLVSED